jgi:methionyl-tRNA formyltransferase
MKIIIANSNYSLNNVYESIQIKSEIEIISDKDELNHEFLDSFNPDWIFFPHWSYIIPKCIYSKFKCVVFHMTDLPFGRGGSPLQNLIVRGITDTKMSAIRVGEGIDTGDIYLKSNLSLLGRAEDIYRRAARLTVKMIHEIIEENPQPYIQRGKVTSFSRRKPHESEIKKIESIDELYDFIRMLDAPGYPKAFIEINNFRFEFSRATLHNDNSIKADVEVKMK